MKQHVIVKYEYRLTATSRKRTTYIRPEGTDNTAKYATRFETMEDAREYVDTIRHDIRSSAYDVEFVYQVVSR